MVPAEGEKRPGEPPAPAAQELPDIGLSRAFLDAHKERPTWGEGGASGSGPAGRAGAGGLARSSERTASGRRPPTPREAPGTDLPPSFLDHLPPTPSMLESLPAPPEALSEDHPAYHYHFGEGVSRGASTGDGPATDSRAGSLAGSRAGSRRPSSAASDGGRPGETDPGDPPPQAAVDPASPSAPSAHAAPQGGLPFFGRRLAEVASQLGQSVLRTATSAGELLSDPTLRRAGAARVAAGAQAATRGARARLAAGAQAIGGAPSAARAAVARAQARVAEERHRQALRVERDAPVDVQMGFSLFEDAPQELRTRLWGALLRRPDLSRQYRLVSELEEAELVERAAGGAGEEGEGGGQATTGGGLDPRERPASPAGGAPAAPSAAPTAGSPASPPSPAASTASAASSSSSGLRRPSGILKDEPEASGEGDADDTGDEAGVDGTGDEAGAGGGGLGGGADATGRADGGSASRCLSDVRRRPGQLASRRQDSAPGGRRASSATGDAPSGSGSDWEVVEDMAGARAEAAAVLAPAPLASARVRAAREGFQRVLMAALAEEDERGCEGEGESGAGDGVAGVTAAAPAPVPNPVPVPGPGEAAGGGRAAEGGGGAGGDAPAAPSAPEAGATGGPTLRRRPPLPEPRASRPTPGSLYATLLEISVGQEDVDDVISRDVHRTFPELARFGTRAGQQALFRVLKAYALRDLEVGYCQGMAFVAGLLLVYVPETQAFETFCELLGPGGPGLRRLYLPGLAGLRAELAELDAALARHLPRARAHLAKHGVVPVLYASQWFLTGFACPLPLPLAARLLDACLLSGSSAPLRACAVAMVALMEHDLLLRDDFEDILTHIKVAPVAWDAATQRRVVNAALRPRADRLDWPDPRDEPGAPPPPAARASFPVHFGESGGAGSGRGGDAPGSAAADAARPAPPAEAAGAPPRPPRFDLFPEGYAEPGGGRRGREVGRLPRPVDSPPPAPDAGDAASPALDAGDALTPAPAADGTPPSDADAVTVHSFRQESREWEANFENMVADLDAIWQRAEEEVIKKEEREEEQGEEGTRGVE